MVKQATDGSLAQLPGAKTVKKVFLDCGSEHLYFSHLMIIFYFNFAIK